MNTDSKPPADDLIAWVDGTFTALNATLQPLVDDMTLAFGPEVLRRERQRLARTQSSRKRRRALRAIRFIKAEMTRAGQRRAKRVQTNEGDSTK